jgi:hypothetical protein
MHINKRVFVSGVLFFVCCKALCRPAEASLSFNDTSDYLAVASDATFPPSGNASVTIEMWFKADSLPESGSTLAGWGTERTCRMHYLALTSAGSVVFSHWGADYYYHAGLTTGVWHHVCAVHDGAANRDDLYIDGTLFGSSSTPPLAVGQTAVRIGQHPNVPNYPFMGTLDEVRIWEVARTGAEIKASLFQRLTVPVPGLVARWGLDDGTGSEALDSSGNNRTAVLTGTPEWVWDVAPETAAPVVGGSFALAQDSADDSVVIGFDSTFPPAGNESMTLEMWFNMSQLPPSGYLGTLAGWGTSSIGRMHFLALTPEGKIIFSHFGYDFYYDVGLTTGVWHHVSAVHDGVNNRDILYLDGQPKGTNTMPALVVGRSKICLGRHPGASGHTFMGQMDEVRIWSVARTAEEILASMNQRLSTPVAGLAGQWGFDEGAGNVAANSAGDYRPAVLLGTPEWVSPGAPLGASTLSFMISLFDPTTGSLTFDEVPAATRYCVEWSSNLTSVAWSSQAPGLPLIPAMGGAGLTVTVGVEQASCFYRVVATLTNTPPTSITSSFETDNEGWQIVDFPYFVHVSNPGTTELFIDDTFGNPANSVRILDVFYETGISAPASYLGDKLAFYGGELSYDIFIRKTDAIPYPAVVLNNGEQSAYYVLPSPPLNVWHRMAVPLTPSGWKDSGTKEEVTEWQFKMILGSLTGIYISTEWNSGDDDTHIDNVTLAPR